MTCIEMFVLAFSVEQLRQLDHRVRSILSDEKPGEVSVGQYSDALVIGFYHSATVYGRAHLVELGLLSG